jgi:hypothetical protein
MKKTLSVHEIANELKNDQYAGWSYDGAMALAEHLDQMDQDSGDDTEFDVVAIRCDFSEYESAQDAASNYAWEFEGDEEEIDPMDLDEKREESALEFLKDNTVVIEFETGIIIQDF